MGVGGIVSRDMLLRDKREKTNKQNLLRRGLGGNEKPIILGKPEPNAYDRDERGQKEVSWVPFVGAARRKMFAVLCRDRRITATVYVTG